MTLWQRLWHGINDSNSDAPLRDILARVETLEPTWTLFDPSPFGDRQALESGAIEEGSEHRCEQRVLDNETLGAKAWCIRMTFSQSTPDGALTTIVHSAANTCRVEVMLEHVGCLENLKYFDSEYADPRGATILRARVNKFAVQYVHDWARQRVLPALEAARQRRIERRNADLRAREAKLAPMRKKYLP